MEVSVVATAYGCIAVAFSHMLQPHHATNTFVISDEDMHDNINKTPSIFLHAIDNPESLRLSKADVDTVQRKTKSTLGAMSTAPTWFDYQYIWATKSALAAAANVDPDDFSTPSGEFFRAEVGHELSSLRYVTSNTIILLIMLISMM